MKDTSNKQLYRWIINLVFSIDKKTVIFWLTLNGIICILPSIALLLNKKILAVIAAFLDAGIGEFCDVLPYIIFYGAVLTISGLSARINSGFLYFRMYDSYYIGLQELLMDFFQKMPMEMLFEKDVSDEYNAVIRRAGALTDVTSASCGEGSWCSSPACYSGKRFASNSAFDFPLYGFDLLSESPYDKEARGF